MEAKEKSFKAIMQEENKFVIPFFQRRYVWSNDKKRKKRDWERFFDDLLESFCQKKEHFLGSIILKRSQSSSNFAHIIDGQQRLTTFSILLKALYDKVDKNHRKHFNSCLFEEYSDDNSPKIQHSKVDKEEYIKIFKQNHEIDSKIDSGILGCYNFFNKRIDEKITQDKIFEFMKFINDSKIWVAVCLNANEDEQKIFDSINSTGEPLSATDIIKNALFDRVIKLAGEDEASRWYQSYWEDIFDKSEDEKEFWDKRITRGRINRVNSEIFFHALAVMNGFFDPDKHRLENLSAIYKEYIKRLVDIKLEDFLLFIHTIATIYKDLPFFTKETLLYYDEWESRFFHIVEVTDTNTIIPLILFLKNKLCIATNNKEIFKECLYLLEILLLCNAETKEYNKFFARLIKELSKKGINNFYKTIKENIIKSFEIGNKTNITDWLKYIISNQDAKLILFWIELYREYKEKDYKDKSIGLKYEYTLEHLMPKRWQTHWENIGKNDEEYADSLIYQIGNMTLLKGKLNANIQNLDWHTKLNGDGKVRNFISKNADLLINKELLNKKEWNEKEIKSRTKRFISDFFSIWDINIFNS